LQSSFRDISLNVLGCTEVCMESSQSKTCGPTQSERFLDFSLWESSKVDYIPGVSTFTGLVEAVAAGTVGLMSVGIAGGFIVKAEILDLAGYEEEAHKDREAVCSAGEFAGTCFNAVARGITSAVPIWGNVTLYELDCYRHSQAAAQQAKQEVSPMPPSVKSQATDDEKRRLWKADVRHFLSQLSFADPASVVRKRARLLLKGFAQHELNKCRDSFVEQRYKELLDYLLQGSPTRLTRLSNQLKAFNRFEPLANAELKEIERLLQRSDVFGLTTAKAREEIATLLAKGKSGSPKPAIKSWQAESSQGER
jgi:hypothetical protein